MKIKKNEDLFLYDSHQNGMLLLKSLYEKHYPELLQLGSFHGSTESETKDIINQTFLDLAEKSIDFSNISNPAAFIKTTFKRKLIDHYRNKKKDKSLYEKLSNSRSTESNQLEKIVDSETSIESIDKLYQSFKKLSPRLQRVIVLKYYRNLTNKQISRLTGLSQQTIYNDLSTGIHRLRSMMKNMGIKFYTFTLILFSFLILST